MWKKSGILPIRHLPASFLIELHQQRQQETLTNIQAKKFPLIRALFQLKDYTRSQGGDQVGGSQSVWQPNEDVWLTLRPAPPDRVGGEKLRRVFPTTGEVTKLCYNKYFQQIPHLLLFPLSLMRLLLLYNWTFPQLDIPLWKSSPSDSLQEKNAKFNF